MTPSPIDSWFISVLMWPSISRHRYSTKMLIWVLYVWRGKQKLRLSLSRIVSSYLFLPPGWPSHWRRVRHFVWCRRWDRGWWTRHGHWTRFSSRVLGSARVCYRTRGLGTYFRGHLFEGKARLEVGLTFSLGKMGQMQIILIKRQTQAFLVFNCLSNSLVLWTYRIWDQISY